MGRQLINSRGCNIDTFCYYQPIDYTFHIYHVIHTGKYLYWGRTITAIGCCCFCYRIDVPLLSDQFDASLVILRRRFCWSYLDLFYKKYEVTHSASLKLSEKAEEKLLSQRANLGEKLLYDRMNTTWWSSAELKQDDFWEEVLLSYLLHWDIDTTGVTLYSI